MIPKEKKLKLISLYMYICDVYNNSLKHHYQRFSNNSAPVFTDEEVLLYICSAAVSNVRQPIEAFFNWLNEKTEIQRVSKVRATKGLLVHIFGKLAIALLSFANV